MEPMPETIEKLRPDRDLQCYFERPSAVAALSNSGPDGYTVSGTWRQQFDWTVIEWNRDNVFEHPAFRNLPDGDLSSFTLTYEETRENCVPLDSTLYPTIDWPFLRVWTDAGGVEDFYKVRLKDYATPVEGEYTPASATFELEGTPTAGDYIELTWSTEHHTYQLYATDTLESAVQAIVDSVNAFSPVMRAARSGKRITLIYVGPGQTLENSRTGINGNRIGVYGNVTGARTENWQPAWQQMSGGLSPTKWRVSLDFSNLLAIDGRRVATQSIRKFRWTYSADLQRASFVRSEFKVTVSEWTVTGANRSYQIAGPGSRRIEDDSREIVYAGSWRESRGNFSGGSLHHTTEAGAHLTIQYCAAIEHELYLGTRRAPNCAPISIVVDGAPARIENLRLAGEDVLVRIALGRLPGQTTHTLNVYHDGEDGEFFYFDFLEVAVPSETLPSFPVDPRVTLATDWDTDHSICLAPERTAWFIRSLGFTGRANHYVGALWFYELYRKGHAYASATVEFVGEVTMSVITELFIGVHGSPDPPNKLEHLNLIGDTLESIAKAFELEINSGYTAVWASAEGAVLTIYSRKMGQEGNSVTISVNTNSETLSATVSGETLTGGEDGVWTTDTESLPRLNRAVRDWSLSYYRSLKGCGIDVVAAFSMELQHGDPSAEAGIAQRYPSGNPVLLNTPALQTNFSPISTEYWQTVYLEMAEIMETAGLVPYLQFGEVQWWYFPYDQSGLPFYDEYTKTRFRTAFGREMHVFVDSQESPEQHPEEAGFLPSLIGEFTDAVIGFVQNQYPETRFEVLYPPDVNDSPLNRAINFPASAWSSGKLACLKTENFTYTFMRNMNLIRDSVRLPMHRGFSRDKASHLVGIGDYTTPWEKEHRASVSEGVESVVLFALDQFCLIGYRVPLKSSSGRSLQLG